MVSFQAKIGWKLPRMKEKKKLSFHSIPTHLGIENYKKIAKKFNKLKNINMASFHDKTGWERPGKREKKLSFRSVSIRPVIVNSK